MYDEAWRMLAVFRGSDTAPKEEWVPKLAGLDGFGGSSQLDGVICRYRDANTAWTAASDGVLEERRYLCQNWRGDVSAIVDTAGAMVEWVKYSSYGIPFALPAGDANSDGACDSSDTTQIQTWINGSTYDVRGDLDLDGDVDATDKTLATNNFVGITLGFSVLSNVGNRRGYAGYERDVNFAKEWHVRNRLLDSWIGRWIKRDPRAYNDGINLYALTSSLPLNYVDPLGLQGAGTTTYDAGNDCGGFDGASTGVEIYECPPKISVRWGGAFKGLKLQISLTNENNDPGDCATGRCCHFSVDASLDLYTEATADLPPDQKKKAEGHLYEEWHNCGASSANVGPVWTADTGHGPSILTEAYTGVPGTPGSGNSSPRLTLIAGVGCGNSKTLSICAFPASSYSTSPQIPPTSGGACVYVRFTCGDCQLGNMVATAMANSAQSLCNTGGANPGGCSGGMGTVPGSNISQYARAGSLK